MRTSLITAGVAIAAITIALMCSGCLVQTNADGTSVRKVDPEARKFWAGAAVRAFLLNDK